MRARCERHDAPPHSGARGLAAGYTILGWRVTDVAAAVEALTAKGVTFMRYDGIDQDENGVWTTPEGDKVAWFNDPDGNTLSLTQFA